jgi:hypothetical protein
MTPKPGRTKSPCSKCGGSERDAAGHCIPCRREYHRKYRPEWVRKRKEAVPGGTKELMDDLSASIEALEYGTIQGANQRPFYKKKAKRKEVTISEPAK